MTTDMAVVRSLVLIVGVVSTGLVAGLFYAYACSVMLGLKHVDDRTFVEVMQKINIAIINPWFLGCFLGSVAILVTGLVLELGAGNTAAAIALGAALGVYALALSVTFGWNVPLNNALAAVDVARIADLAAARRDFEGSWVRWNIVRAVLHTGAFGLLCAILVVGGAGRA